MCGIVAILAYGAHAPPVEEAELTAIRDAMAIRGPDDFGNWLSPDGRVGLGHRRLSIIDPSPAGHQPMAHGEDALVITFNGEIYNFVALRDRLAQEGHEFRTNSDTEVLLHLYERHGADMVRHLRGMYTFVIWDAARAGMLLARDPFGIKPLYTADDGASFRVASQVKALRAGGNAGKGASPAGHVGFFLWGHVPDPHTLYADIRALPAGSTQWIDHHGAQPPQRFFTVAETMAGAGEGEPPSAAELRDMLADSVGHHLVADVPVGVFLSAGLDSTTITAFASRTAGADLRTVTLAFDEYAGTAEDEAPLAERVAAAFGTAHETRRVRRADFEAARTHLLAAMDQPTIDGVNTYFVARETAATGLKVALSGIGGDELFGGYPSFEQIPKLSRALGPLRALPCFGRNFRRVSAPILKRFTSPKYASLFEYGTSAGGAYLLRRGLFMPWELPGILDGELVRAGWAELGTLARLEETTIGLRGPRQVVSALEMTWYMRNQLLRDADWAGMAHSLEIRVPFADPVLLRALAPALAGAEPPTKRDMASTPPVPLPDEVLARPKTGFAVPVRDWIMGGRGGTGAERGMRGWARQVYRAATAG